MKKVLAKKTIAMMLAVMVTATPVSSVSFASEEPAAENTTVTKEVETPAPVQEVKKAEEPATSPEPPAPAEEPAKTPAAEQTAQTAPEVPESAAQKSASQNTASVQQTPAQEEQIAVEQAAPKAAKSSYKVTIVVNDIMTTSGSTSYTTSATVSANGSKTYSATTMNGWVKTKSAHYNGVTYKFDNQFRDSSGNIVTALTIKGADLEDDATLTLTPVYTEVADMVVTVNFNNILKANGEVTSSTTTNTLTSGSGWNFTQTKLNNMVTAKSFSLNGIKYEYSGKWVDDQGNEFESLSVKNTGETSEIIYNISPVYNMTKTKVLKFHYIDNISTGSGSWQNVDEFSSFSHTFKQPAAKAHYKFVEWKDLDNGDTYNAGSKFSFKSSDFGTDEEKEFNIYAMWQPSITVEYYSGSKLLKSVETTDNNIEAYGYQAADSAESKSGAHFIGWFEGNGEDAAKIAEGSTYELPAVTAKPTEQKIVKLYAKYTADYNTEYYLESLHGGYELAAEETEQYKGAALGSNVKAEIKEFEGFTLNRSAEGSLLEANAKAGLTLKVYYSRNSYDVTYNYEGEVPAKASALPEKKAYKYGQSVEIAEAATAAGYTFSGWSTEDAFKMPAKAVEITGSFTANEDTKYVVEHYMENLEDDGFTINEEETEVFEGTTDQIAKAEPKEFEGFTFDSEVEGTVQEGAIEGDGSLVLKLYYKRNLYEVTYEYEGDVIPEKAEEQLPETASYKYEQEVPEGSQPSVSGFEFSGWDGEVDNMPANDVTVVGSWAEIPEDAAPIAKVDENTDPGDDGSKNNENSKSKKNGQNRNDGTVNVAANEAPTTASTDEAKAEEISDGAVPMTISDNETPKAETGVWALINLLCTLATVLLSLIMLAGLFGRKEKEDEETGETIEIRQKRAARLFSIIPAIGAAIAFILTENMHNPMAMTDNWTVLMIVILAAELAVLVEAKKTKKNEEERA